MPGSAGLIGWFEPDSGVHCTKLGGGSGDCDAGWVVVVGLLVVVVAGLVVVVAGLVVDVVGLVVVVFGLAVVVVSGLVVEVVAGLVVVVVRRLVVVVLRLVVVVSASVVVVSAGIVVELSPPPVLDGAEVELWPPPLLVGTSSVEVEAVGSGTVGSGIGTESQPGAPGPPSWQALVSGPTTTDVSVSSAKVGSCPTDGSVFDAVVAVDAGWFTSVRGGWKYSLRSASASASSVFDPRNRRSEPTASIDPPSCRLAAIAAGWVSSAVSTTTSDPDPVLVLGSENTTVSANTPSPRAASVPCLRYSGSA